MRIINERMSLEEAVGEYFKQEAARREEEQEKEAYEMEVAALGWAEDAAELWIPAKYPPVENGDYLTINERKNISISYFYNGKWNAYITAWLPLPETL